MALFHNRLMDIVVFFAQMKIRSKGKTTETRLKTDTSDLLLFQKQLEDRIRLSEEEKETESVVTNKVKLLFFLVLCSP